MLHLRRGSLALILVALAIRTTSAATVPSFTDSDGGQWPLPAKNAASTRCSSLSEIDTMYVVTPLPNTLFAFDLTRPGASVQWRFDPAAHGVASSDVVNRGAAYGKIVYNTLDGPTDSFRARHFLAVVFPPPCVG